MNCSCISLWQNFQESLSTQGRRKLEDYVKYSSGTSGSALPTDHSPQVWIFLLAILPWIAQNFLTLGTGQVHFEVMLTIHGFSQAVSPAGYISIAAGTSCCSRVCDLATSFSSCKIWWFLLSERSEKKALDREWWSHVDQVHERSWRTSSSSGTREICVIILRWDFAVPCDVEQLQRVQLRMRSRNSCSRASWREMWRLSISATCEIFLSMAGNKMRPRIVMKISD
jgi:hypothetical protein